MHVWTKTGYSDLNNLGRALEKHNKSKEHIAFACKFVLFGKQNIAIVIDPTATAIPRSKAPVLARNSPRSENGNRKV
jgi:hypothetical protein